MALDPVLIDATENVIAVSIITWVARTLKRGILASQSDWKKKTFDHLISIDNTILDFKEESAKRRIDFEDLKKSLLSSIIKMESNVAELMKVLPVIAALKGFIETNNKRHNGNETEIIKLSEEVRLIRDKINKS